ncbi:MAG: DUF192 domain-containing protein [Pseudomonadota bacterium]
MGFSVIRYLLKVPPVLLLASILGCPHNKAMEPPAAKTGTVFLEGAQGKISVKVEIVSTPEERTTGLMYRKHLPADAGMLFLFDKEEVQSFWMKNTHIPLDMIFIDERKLVVGIVQNAEPQTTESRKVAAPSRYVLEVNAGFVETHRISVGAKALFEGVEP